MDALEILTDAAQRPLDAANALLPGLGVDVLHQRASESTSSIAWLVWHAARQLDVQCAELTGGDEVWTSGGWGQRLGVARGAGDFGIGDDAAAVGALRVSSADDLLAYVEACTRMLQDHLAGLSEADLDDIVDTSWDPPVTRGVRLVSIIDDAAAHLGQASWLRGLLDRWRFGV